MFLFRHSIVVGATLTILQPQFAVAQDVAAVNNIAKDITVKIIAQQGNGSGVIYAREGNIYSVITNQHVIAEDTSYQIQTRDGTQHQVTTKIEIPGLDLAIVTFESTQTYELATFGNSDRLTEQQPISVAGFPGEQTEINIVSGSIRSIKQGTENLEAEKGYALTYTNEVLPGSSGGAVLDQQGNVIAINGQGKRDVISGRDISKGIPINLFLTAANISSSYKIVLTIPSSFTADSSDNIFDVAENKVAVSDNIIASNNGQDGTIELWNLTTGVLERSLSGHPKAVTDIKIGNDKIASASSQLAGDETIKIWNLTTGELEQSLDGHTDAVTDVAVSENKIVSGSADNSIKVWQRN